MPVDDIEEHILQFFCKCGPVTTSYNYNLITTHNAFDKREAIEEAHRAMGVEHPDNNPWGRIVIDKKPELN